MSIFQVGEHGTITTDIYDKVVAKVEILKLKEQIEELLKNKSKLETECKNSEELIKFLRKENNQLKTHNENLLKNTEQNKLNENFQRLKNEKKILNQTNNKLENELIISEEKINNLLENLRGIYFPKDI